MDGFLGSRLSPFVVGETGLVQFVSLSLWPLRVADCMVSPFFLPLRFVTDGTWGSMGDTVVSFRVTFGFVARTLRTFVREVAVLGLPRLALGFIAAPEQESSFTIAFLVDRFLSGSVLWSSSPSLSEGFAPAGGLPSPLS